MRYLLLLILLSGCYTRQKATNQFSRAAVAYPELPAGYCARTYPPKDSLIKGDSVVTFDTIYTGGETVFDTVRVADTIRIVKTIQLPGTRIIERVYKTDTIVKINTAALDLCSIERGRALALAEDKTAEAAKWRALAKKRFWIITGMGAAMALGLFLALRRKVVNKATGAGLFDRGR